MGNTEDHREMTPKDALVHHPNDHLSFWRTSAELFWRCEDIVLSLGSTIPIISEDCMWRCVVYVCLYNVLFLFVNGDRYSNCSDIQSLFTRSISG